MAKNPHSLRPRIRALFEKYPPMVRFDADDHEFLLSILALDPRAKQKIGCGIESFFIEVVGDWKPGKGFAFFRTDGTRDKLSWQICLRHLPKDPKINK